MSSKWPKYRIEDLTQKIAMGPFGSNIKVETFVDSGVPIISGEHLRSMRMQDGRFNFISEEHSERLRNSLVTRGDVVFTHAGNIGQVAYIPEASRFQRYVISQRQFYARCDQTKIIPEFLAYFFHTPEGRHKLLSNASQVGVPSIARPSTHLKSIEISVPPVDYQKSVCEIISALDDRITLLRETNATLEAIAQALFKSWFVDFDPVHAKQESRVPDGINEATAALFPDTFEESELGVIPCGWRWASLADTYEINPQRKLKKGIVASYLDMASVHTFGHCADSVVQREMGSGSKFQNGDTLLARITPCLENGKSAFVDFLDDGEIAWGSTEFVVLRPKAPLPEYHAYLLCRHQPFREFAVQSMSGTSGRQRIQNDVLGRYCLAVPSESVALAFGAIVGPIQQKISDNHAQAQTLATLRDTLLPRLISGQIQLDEAKEEVCEAL